MTVLIKNADVVEQLDRHSKSQDVPVTKGRLAVYIIREVLTAAEKQNKGAGEVLRDLQKQSTEAA